MELSTKQQESIKYLKSVIKPNSIVYIVQNSVSNSGMTRRLDLFIKTKGSRLQRITWEVSNILEWNLNDRGLKVGGCGMDMHFHTMNVLTSYLYPRGSKNFNGNGGSCINWQSL